MSAYEKPLNSVKKLNYFLCRHAGHLADQFDKVISPCRRNLREPQNIANRYCDVMRIAEAHEDLERFFICVLCGVEVLALLGEVA